MSIPPHIHCPECGTIMRYGEHPEVVRYKGRIREAIIACWWCPDCGETVLDGPGLLQFEAVYVSLRDEVDAKRM